MTPGGEKCPSKPEPWLNLNAGLRLEKTKTGIIDKQSIWVFPKMVLPNNHWFPTKNDHFGLFWWYHHLRKHPYLEIDVSTLV